MPVRPRKRTAPVSYRPPMPAELRMYHPGDWDAPRPDGSGTEWGAGHRAAYARFQRAALDWRNEFGHLPVDPSTVPKGDVPWCGEVADHDCGGADCPRRPTRRNIGFAGLATADGADGE